MIGGLVAGQGGVAYAGAEVATAAAMRPPAAVGSVLPPGNWALQLAIGRSFGEPLHEVAPFEWIGNLRVGLSDDVQLSLLSPGIAWRLGKPGAVEVVLDARLRSGARGWGLEAIPWVGSSLRLYTGPSSSFLVGAQAGIVYTQNDLLRVWMWSSQAGWIVQMGRKMTLAVGVAANFEREIRLYALGGGPRTTVPGVGIAFGSVLHLASAPLPLLSVRLSDAVSVDGYGSLLLHPDDKVEGMALAGATLRF